MRKEFLFFPLFFALLGLLAAGVHFRSHRFWGTTRSTAGAPVVKEDPTPSEPQKIPQRPGSPLLIEPIPADKRR